MSFLSPWFFLGLAAIAGPLIAHLRRLSVKRRLRFSAVEFLEARPPKSSRQRWEDLLLMALRVLALALFVLAFARPFFNTRDHGASATTRGRRVALLLDTSASMRRGGLFADAIQKAGETALTLGPDDELEILSFDRSVRTLLTFDSWRGTPLSQRAALFKKSLQLAAPSWAETRLDEALRFTAEQQFEDSETRPFEVAVISDLQEGASLAALQGAQWPARFSVRVLSVSPPAGSQSTEPAALHWITPDPESVRADAPFQLQVLAPHEFSKDSVRLVAELHPPREWAAPASSDRSKLTHVPGSGGAPVFIHPAETQHPLFGVWAAPLPVARTLVAIGRGGASEDHTVSRYFIEKALRSFGSSRVEVLPDDTKPGPRDADVGLWISGAGAGSQWIERMRSAVEAGASALIQLEGPADGPLLGSLLGVDTSVTEADVSGYAILGEMDRTHPLFTPFRPPQFADFTGIRFWKYRRVVLPQNSGAKVLAHFDGGDPALIECALGKGKLLFSTFGWKPLDGQWVLSSRCVPFLAACLEWSGGGRRVFFTAVPGEDVSLPAGTTGLKSQDGREIPAQNLHFQADAPGVYSIEPGGGVLVVNLARSESKFAPVDPSKLQALGVPLLPQERSDSTEGAPDGSTGVPLAQEIESRQGVWRWLLAAVLGLLALETLWAGRLSSAKERTS